ncbi:MAG: hypothetical protein Q4B64_01790 [Spirochaetales bacterium]|nr:hypothetical protein [Spirochaetales bacterium]
MTKRSLMSPAPMPFVKCFTKTKMKNTNDADKKLIGIALMSPDNIMQKITLKNIRSILFGTIPNFKSLTEREMRNK